MLSSFVTTCIFSHPKCQFCHHLLTLMSFQTCMSFFMLNTKKILKNFEDQTVANHQLFDYQHSSKCLHVQHKKKLIQVNNDMRVRRIFTFRVNYPFISMHITICRLWWMIVYVCVVFTVNIIVAPGFSASRIDSDSSTANSFKFHVGNFKHGYFLFKIQEFYSSYTHYTEYNQQWNVRSLFGSVFHPKWFMSV